MRLKKLIVQGFKSFADRTEFVFDAPITGIVGPNGCGKSNVVDAFKWVLGEQSAKSLRGDAMLDVIFNGAASRKPAGMAEVTLVFENPLRDDGSRTLNLEQDEVSVGRRLFRDGVSEYQLNNQSSRLKDIRELFLDTGVGVDAYSVIEQGRVAALLEANPAERRLIFEEAAGISKFKARKKESQRKLEKVDQNLLRVNDIFAEVQKQLRGVRIQAGRARTYQEYSQRLGELRLSYVLQEFHTLQQQAAGLEQERQEAEFRRDDAAADLARCQNELAERRQKFEDLSRRRQAVEYDRVQAAAAIESAQHRQQYATQQLQQFADQGAQFERDHVAIQTKAYETDQNLCSESEQLALLTDELQTQAAQITERQAAYRDAQLQLATLNQSIEKDKSTILELMRKAAQTANALGAVDIERRNLAQQQQRTADRRRQVVGEQDALAARATLLQHEVDAASDVMRGRQLALEEKRSASAALGKQIAQSGENLGAAREHRSGLQSRQNLLQDLEARREGVSEGVQEVLRQRDGAFAFVRGLVADVLRVDIDHALIIEAALDGSDQWLLTPDSQCAQQAAAIIQELSGRVNILCTDGLQLPGNADVYDWNRHPQSIRLATDLVRFDAADAAVAYHLLGRTVVVDDLAAAASLRGAGPAGYRYVTRHGEVLEADGTLRAGPLNAAMGLLSRRSELEALKLQLAEVDDRIGRLNEQMAQSTAQARELDEAQNQLRNAIYHANTARVELTSQLAQNTDQRSALGRELPVLERELAAFHEQIGQLESRQIRLTEERQQIEIEQTRRQESANALILTQQQVEANLGQWGEQLTAARVQLGQAQEKQIAVRQHVQRLTASQAELVQQLQRVSDGIKALTSRREDVATDLQSAQRAVAQHQETQTRLTTQAGELQTQVAEASQATQGLTTRVEVLREAHIEIEKLLHQTQLRSGEVRIRLETLTHRTMEEMQLDLPARHAELDAAEGGFQPADIDYKAVSEEIRQLREKIARLGNINVDAIGEQDSLEEREKFYQTQLADLAESKRQLAELIDTINRESSIRFEQTFAAVREHFQGLFRKLFGGGKADIFLETELEPVAGEMSADGSAPVRQIVDPLDAGIEIIARPPGKQPVSISQLSGGEKTMTCVALLMSIFKSKPSPFCILDEVDAALDEANNQRFNMIVQEFLGQSQFIVITHSKRTMQIADVLYGVTMQEQGVSRRVAVKFDQVDSHGRIAETAAA